MSRRRSAPKVPRTWGGCGLCGRPVRIRRRGNRPVAPRRKDGLPIHDDCARENEKQEVSP